MAPTRLRRVRDSPWAQESSSGYSTSVCRSCCRACSICRRCGALLRSATTSLRAAAQKQILLHVFAREDNGAKVLDGCRLHCRVCLQTTAPHLDLESHLRPSTRHAVSQCHFMKTSPTFFRQRQGTGMPDARECMFLRSAAACSASHPCAHRDDPTPPLPLATPTTNYRIRKQDWFRGKIHFIE